MSYALRGQNGQQLPVLKGGVQTGQGGFGVGDGEHGAVAIQLNGVESSGQARVADDKGFDPLRGTGYRDGGFILQIVKRLDQRSQKGSKKRETMGRLKKKVSSVEV